MIKYDKLMIETEDSFQYDISNVFHTDTTTLTMLHL